jgi:hypothetical protein
MADLTPWQQALLYENRANPYPFYAELRKTPVSRQPNGTYVVSTYGRSSRYCTIRGSAQILESDPMRRRLRRKPLACRLRRTIENPA